jgi:uncharacterized phiE125 gp8 family phage protein
MALSLVTPPSGSIVAMSEIYDHLRVDLTGSPEEPVDATLITALRDAAEAYLDGHSGIMGRALLTQTWDLKLHYLPAVINLPLPPLQSVTSITYVDTNGDSQTLAASVYQVVDNGNSPSQIVEAYNQDYPSTRDQPHAVTVRFVAGYGAADDVPDPIKIAIKLLVSQWYDRRESVVIGKTVAELPFAVRALLGPYRLPMFG